MFSLIDVKTVLKFLEEDNKISLDETKKTLEWIQSNSLKINDNIINDFQLLSLLNRTSKLLSYEERSELSTHPLNKKLFALMAKKKSNLCVALDLTESQKILSLAEKIGKSIVVLKLHIDTVSDFTLAFIEKLQEIARVKEFMIFEDRKYADIGNTVKLQYTAGIYKTSSWADIINAHLVSGPGVIEGLRSGIAKVCHQFIYFFILIVFKIYELFHRMLTKQTEDVF